jgi:hypothetical protein
MLVSEAKTALKTYGFADGDPLSSWLEAAKQRVEESDDWPFLQKIAVQAVLAGVSVPTLPADLFKPISLRDVTNNRKLSYKDPVGFDRDIEDPTDTGFSTTYTLTGTQTAVPVLVTVWPINTLPWSCRIFYQATLTDITGLADGATLPGPLAFHYIYVLGAAAIALQADNEEDRAATAQTTFEAALGHQRRKWFSDLDEARTVQDVMGYGVS